MATNRVIFGDEVLLDVSQDTVTPETLAEGVTAHNRDGEQIVGTMSSGGSDADTVDGLHAVVSNTEATVDDTSVITFILGG